MRSASPSSGSSRSDAQNARENMRSGKYITDYHLHSNISPDGNHTMAEMAKAAVETGVDELCFTDHVEPLHWLKWNDPPRKKGSYDWEAMLRRQLSSASSPWEMLRNSSTGNSRRIHRWSPSAAKCSETMFLFRSSQPSTSSKATGRTACSAYRTASILASTSVGYNQSALPTVTPILSS